MKEKTYRNWKKNGRKGRGHGRRARNASADGRDEGFGHGVLESRRMRIVPPPFCEDVAGRESESGSGYKVPNKYLERPETDESGVVKGCETPALLAAGACIAVFALLAAAVWAAVS